MKWTFSIVSPIISCANSVREIIQRNYTRIAGSYQRYQYWKSRDPAKESACLQVLAPGSKNAEFSRSIVPSLSADVSGNSLRVGSIYEAAARSVSPYAVIMHGGHDMTGQSASWEYVITTPMSALPGTTLKNQIKYFYFQLQLYFHTLIFNTVFQKCQLRWHCQDIRLTTIPIALT